MKETLEYQNFRFIEQVPHCFDQFYLCGIGPICSEFYGGEGIADSSAGELNFLPCLELMLSETPKGEARSEHEEP